MFQFRTKTMKGEEEYLDIPTILEGFAVGIEIF